MTALETGKGFASSCLSLDGNPAVRISFETAKRQFLEQTGHTWIHLQVDDVIAVTQLLVNDFGFHPLEVEDALSSMERPKISGEADAFFMVVPSYVGVEDHEEKFCEVAFFVRRHGMVTVANQAVPALPPITRYFENRSSPERAPLGHVLHAILDAVVDDFFPAMDTLSEAVEDLEAAIYDGKKVSIQEVICVKRRLLVMRKCMTPLRDVVNGLLRLDLETSLGAGAIYFQDIYDHALRLLETIDMERDIVSGVMEAHLSVTSNSLNEVMKKMTVFATVLMSCAFVTGLYGMNFDSIPELHWAHGYGFAWAFMAVVTFLELLAFKLLRWF